MVAEKYPCLTPGRSLEILKEGGSEAKLELPNTIGGGKGGIQARKLPIQRTWIHVFPRRMQLYSSAVCSTYKKVNYILIVKVSMIANISVESAYFWFQHKLFVKGST